MSNLNRIFKLAAFLLLFAALCAGAAQAQTTAFTYQGQLSDGANAASGTYQMQFSLFDAATNGNQIGATITNTNVNVAKGVFTVQLDFSPATPFASGAARYLSIAVKKAAETNYTTLDPRQQITSAPYTIRTLSAGVADALSANCVGCVSNAQIAAVDGSKVTGGATITNLNASNLTSGTVPIARLGTNTPTATTFLRGDNTFASVAGLAGGAVLDLVATKTDAPQTLSVTNQANTGDLVTFNNVVTTPTIGSYNAATNTYTVGAAGLYLIQVQSLSVEPSPPTNTLSAWFYFEFNGNAISNDNLYKEYVSNAGGGSNLPTGLRGRGGFSGVQFLTAGTQLRVRGLGQNSTIAATLRNDGSCKLTIVKLN